MRAFVAVFVCTVGLNAVPANAQNVCPCVPVSHMWIVKTCADWTCASVELAVANGDPQVIAMPVSLDDARWMIVRRFAAGSAVDSAGDPFRLEQFDGMAAAVAHFSAIDRDHWPMLMTAPDGQVLVISLRAPAPKRRASHP
jgi:hypothetical protein